VLHLYLEVLELLVEETHRVLQPQGELQVLLPHFGDRHSEGTLRRTQASLEHRYGNASLSRYAGPFTTFWADLYRDRTWEIRCVKPESV